MDERVIAVNTSLKIDDSGGDFAKFSGICCTMHKKIKRYLATRYKVVGVILDVFWSLRFLDVGVELLCLHMSFMKSFTTSPDHRLSYHTMSKKADDNVPSFKIPLYWDLHSNKVVLLNPSLLFLLSFMCKA